MSEALTVSKIDSGQRSEGSGHCAIDCNSLNAQYIAYLARLGPSTQSLDFGDDSDKDVIPGFFYPEFHTTTKQVLFGNLCSASNLY